MRSSFNATNPILMTNRKPKFPHSFRLYKYNVNLIVQTAGPRWKGPDKQPFHINVSAKNKRHKSSVGGKYSTLSGRGFHRNK